MQLELSGRECAEQQSGKRIDLLVQVGLDRFGFAPSVVSALSTASKNPCLRPDRPSAWITALLRR